MTYQVYNHQLIIGDTYDVQATLKEKNVALDLTGASGACYIWHPDGRVASEPTVTILDEANGVIAWHLDAEETEELPRADYTFAVVITFADDTVWTVIKGKVSAVLRRS